MRHLRRSGKKISSRQRTASEGDVIDKVPEPRESFRMKMSAIQADLKNFSPLRACRLRSSIMASVKKGAENKAFEEHDIQNSVNGNDVSIMSTFRSVSFLPLYLVLYFQL